MKKPASGFAGRVKNDQILILSDHSKPPRMRDVVVVIISVVAGMNIGGRALRPLVRFWFMGRKRRIMYPVQNVPKISMKLICEISLKGRASIIASPKMCIFSLEATTWH